MYIQKMPIEILTLYCDLVKEAVSGITSIRLKSCEIDFINHKNYRKEEEFEAIGKFNVLTITTNGEGISAVALLNELMKLKENDITEISVSEVPYYKNIQKITVSGFTSNAKFEINFTK